MKPYLRAPHSARAQPPPWRTLGGGDGRHQRWQRQKRGAARVTTPPLQHSRRAQRHARGDWWGAAAARGDVRRAVGRRRVGATERLLATRHYWRRRVLNVASSTAAGASATARSLGVRPCSPRGARAQRRGGRGAKKKQKHVRRRSVRGGAAAAGGPLPRRREAAKLVVAVALKQVVVGHRRGPRRCEARQAAPTLSAAAASALAEARRDGARKRAAPTCGAQTRATAEAQVRWRGTAADFGISAGTTTSNARSRSPSVRRRR